MTTILHQDSTGDYPEQEHDTEHDTVLQLPELNGVDLVMSLSPKGTSTTITTNNNLTSLQQLQNLHNSTLHNHSTPFSVTDILSPIEEYRKLELNANPPSPYRLVNILVYYRKKYKKIIVKK